MLTHQPWKMLKRRTGWYKAAPEEAGDTWTWTAIDADSKLIVSYLVGGSDAEYAMEFMDDLAARLAHRAQLTSDGYKAYLEAAEGAFGCFVDMPNSSRCMAPRSPRRAATARQNALAQKRCVLLAVQTLRMFPPASVVDSKFVQLNPVTLNLFQHPSCPKERGCVR